MPFAATILLLQIFFGIAGASAIHTPALRMPPVSPADRPQANGVGEMEDELRPEAEQRGGAAASVGASWPQLCESMEIPCGAGKMEELPVAI